MNKPIQIWKLRPRFPRSATAATDTLGHENLRSTSGALAPSNRLRRTGFTLIEMLVVIIIVATLVGMLGGAYVEARNHAKRARAETQLRELVKAWAQYYQTYGGWPTSGNDIPMTYSKLTPLFAAGNSNSIPFLSIQLQPSAGNADPPYTDPWGNTYKVSFGVGVENQESALRISVAFPNRNRYQ